MRTLLLLLGVAAPLMWAQPPVWMLPNLQVDEMSGGSSTAVLAENDSAAYGRVFPPTQSGAQSNWLTIEITSAITATGSGDLYLTTPAFTSGGANFALNTAGFATWVVPGSATSFQVAFAPQSAGTFSATITFQWQEDPYSNPGVWTNFRVNVQGDTSGGPVAYLAAYEAAVSGVRVYHDQPPINQRNFGRRKLDAGPTPSLSLWLYNEGGPGAPDLNLGTPSLTSGGSEFTLDLSGFSGTLAAGAAAEVVVAFDPANVGVQSATIEFTQSDGVNASPFRILMIGEGLTEAAQLRVCDNAGPFFDTLAGPPDTYIGTHLAENSAAGGNRDFGTVSTGGPATLTITLCNADVGYISPWGYVAGADLVVGTPVVTGDADFTVTVSGMNSPVVSAGTTTFVIRFSPKADGVRSAVVEIPHGDASECAPFRINVTGIGDMSGSNSGGDGGGGCSSTSVPGGWPALLAVIIGAIAAAHFRRAAAVSAS